MIVQILLVNILEMNIFKIHCFLFYWKPQLSSPKCSLLCKYDCTQFHNKVFMVLSVIITIFQMTKENCWEVTWLAQGHTTDVKLQPMLWVLEIHILSGFMKSVKRQIRIWTKSALKSILTAISHYHILFLYLFKGTLKNSSYD